jgi:hypothetical protein
MTHLLVKAQQKNGISHNLLLKVWETERQVGVHMQTSTQKQEIKSTHSVMGEILMMPICIGSSGGVE